MDRFNDYLHVTFFPPKWWRLEQKLTYRDVDLSECHNRILKQFEVDISPSNRITVPPKFFSDLASVPRICWWFVAPFDIARPAVIHDYIYRKLRGDKGNIKKARKIADDMLYNSIDLITPEVSRVKKAAIYYGVRLFGWIGLRYGKNPEIK